MLERHETCLNSDNLNQYQLIKHINTNRREQPENVADNKKVHFEKNRFEVSKP